MTERKQVSSEKPLVRLRNADDLRFNLVRALNLMSSSIYKRVEGRVNWLLGQAGQELEPENMVEHVVGLAQAAFEIWPGQRPRAYVSDIVDAITGDYDSGRVLRFAIAARFESDARFIRGQFLLDTK